MSLTGRLAPHARAAVKSVAAVGDLIRRPPHGIIILIYHRVGAGAGGEMDLPPGEFDAQIAWLAETQRLLTLDEALDELCAAPTVNDIEPGVVSPSTTAPPTSSSSRCRSSSATASR